MSLAFCPVPFHMVHGTADTWRPFIERIARRSKFDVQELIYNVLRGYVHICLAWDAEKNRAQALLAIQGIQRGRDAVADIVWATGVGRDEWTALYPDLEKYIRDFLGYKSTIRIHAPVLPARLAGWGEILEPLGYRPTHILYEKDL